MQLIFSVSPELTASSALRIPHDSFEPLLISLHGVFFYSIRDYKIKAGMMQLVNVLSLRLDEVKYRCGKEYSPLDTHNLMDLCFFALAKTFIIK